MVAIERSGHLDRNVFVRDYIAGNRPLIVSDAMDDWPAKAKWTADFFMTAFGNLHTQVYDTLFTLQDTLPLRTYIERSFHRDDDKFAGTYARWYAKLKDVEFDWSDAVFDAVADDWSHPYFLPTSAYIMPLCRPPSEVLAHRDIFPYKAFLISPRGGRTRLHRDPFGTDTVLCQIQGSKRVTFYHPVDAPKLMNGQYFVDPCSPNRELFPDFCRVRPAMEDELRPGETLFIPSGWFHDVVSLTDCISLTWSFVHAANREPFIRELSNPDVKSDRDVIEFFFGSGTRSRRTVAEIRDIAASVEQ